MENGPFEDVLPIEDGDFPASHLFFYQSVPQGNKNGMFTVIFQVTIESVVLVSWVFTVRSCAVSTSEGCAYRSPFLQNTVEAGGIDAVELSPLQMGSTIWVVTLLTNSGKSRFTGIPY